MRTGCQWALIVAGLALWAEAAEPGARIVGLRTDQVRHAPGGKVRIAIEVANDRSEAFRGELRWTVRNLADEVAAGAMPLWLPAGGTGSRRLDWVAPRADFTGYGVDVDLREDSGGVDQASVAVDVSSDWTRFPRYGFFSDCGPDQSDEEIARRVRAMARYHLNAVQFYDWMYTHDRLLKRAADGSLAPEWTDWAGRTISADVLRKKVAAAHRAGMAALAYGLMYGDSGGDRPERLEWAAFREPGQSEWDQVESHPRTNAFLFVMDVTNENWRRQLFAEFRAAIREFGFDGLHLDNLGARQLYRRGSAAAIEERTAFPAFIAAAKRALPGIRVLHNDVMGNYRDEIAKSEADVYYQEVWGRETYQELRDAILDAQAAADGKKAVVLAAYIHKHEPEPRSEWIDDAAARLLDAAIFANGGFHLELGEGAELLVHEYFPIRHPRARPSLQLALRANYDALVRHQNLLSHAPGGNLRDATPGARISSDSHALDKNARSESIWTVVKVREGEYDLVNLINLCGVDVLWRNRSEPPRPQRNIRLKYRLDRAVRQVWWATPDDGLARPRPLEFREGRDADGYFVEVEIPSLEYWDLVVFDQRRP